MTTDIAQLDAWWAESFPNDLGDNDHRWCWLSHDNGTRDIMWIHRCNEGKLVAGWIDITSGNYHTLVSAEPLHIEASVLCPVCGDHGFIRDGRWVKA